jgi:hemerythrin-like domain-containing protein
MPAKRHPSLIPLSHDHHHGLVLAFRLREGLPRNRKPSDSPQEQAEDAVRFFRDNLVPHCRAEEEALFPAMRDYVPHAAALLDTLTTEHAEMRSYIDQLSQVPHDDATLPQLLEAFGDLLERHIRREERELFPLYEARLSETDTARIGADILRLIGR